jgi:hypothetical protein
MCEKSVVALRSRFEFSRLGIKNRPDVVERDHLPQCPSYFSDAGVIVVHGRDHFTDSLLRNRVRNGAGSIVTLIPRWPTGECFGAIASASPYAEPGRSHVDLERGIFYRKPIGSGPPRSARRRRPYRRDCLFICGAGGTAS